MGQLGDRKCLQGVLCGNDDTVKMLRVCVEHRMVQNGVKGNVEIARR